MSEYIAATTGSYALVAMPHADSKVIKLTIVGWRCGGLEAWPVLVGPQIPGAIVAVPQPNGHVRIMDCGGYIPVADFQAYARGLANK